MGFFSWKTSDTKRSISNSFSSKPTFPVALILPDNTRFIEENYEGYGEFGGVDIYSVIAKLNGKGDDRSYGISLLYNNNPAGNWALAASHGAILPKLAENLEARYEDLPYPTNCPDQGYFYGE